jgi:hypothetical protein
MHAYRILLPSETDDSRFNSREKHMLTDSVQPYNKPIIDLACSVCTVKYQTSVYKLTRNTCMQQLLAYIFQTLFQHEVFVTTPTLNAGSRFTSC